MRTKKLFSWTKFLVSLRSWWMLKMLGGWKCKINQQFGIKWIYLEKCYRKPKNLTEEHRNTFRILSGLHWQSLLPTVEQILAQNYSKGSNLKIENFSLMGFRKFMKSHRNKENSGTPSINRVNTTKTTCKQKFLREKGIICYTIWSHALDFTLTQLPQEPYSYHKKHIKPQNNPYF